jgi:hypothetical protein
MPAAQPDSISAGGHRQSLERLLGSQDAPFAGKHPRDVLFEWEHYHVGSIPLGDPDLDVDRGRGERHRDQHRQQRPH